MSLICSCGRVNGPLPHEPGGAGASVPVDFTCRAWYILNTSINREGGCP